MPEKPKRKYTKKSTQAPKYLNSPQQAEVKIYKGEDFNEDDVKRCLEKLKIEDGLHVTSVINGSKVLEMLGKPTLLVLNSAEILEETEWNVTAYWTRNSKCIGSFMFRGFKWGYQNQEVKNLVSFIANCGIKIRPETIFTLTGKNLPLVLER